MKNFLAIYTGSPGARSRWESLSDAQRNERQAAGFRAWGEWVSTNQASIVESGSPLGRTKLVSNEGISDVRNELAAYVVVRAESHEAAAMLFRSHPHFALFPGEGVEIMECLPIPNA